MAASSGRIPRWKHLNDIRAWVAREHGAIVQLADEAWDRERFAEGQLVLLTAGPGASAAAARDFVYRLPTWMCLCASRTSAKPSGHRLRRARSRARRALPESQRGPSPASHARQGRNRQTDQARTHHFGKRAGRRPAHSADRQPTLARRTRWREPVEFIDPDLDPGQQQVVTAAVAADDLLVVQGPPGTGKTTTICEIVWQYLAKDPHAQILIAAPDPPGRGQRAAAPGKAGPGPADRQARERKNRGSGAGDDP